jgi:hypothetical protein
VANAFYQPPLNTPAGTHDPATSRRLSAPRPKRAMTRAALSAFARLSSGRRRRAVPRRNEEPSQDPRGTGGDALWRAKLGAFHSMLAVHGLAETEAASAQSAGSGDAHEPTRGRGA